MLSRDFTVHKLTELLVSKVLWFQVLIFLIIATLLLLKPLSYGLFIDKVGIANLPFAYILIAGVSTIFTYLYSKIVAGRAPLQLLTISFTISILFLVSVYVTTFFYAQSDFIYYGLFVFISIYGLMSASQFWLSVNTNFSKQNVKRNFAKLGTGAILGGICGGYFASIWTTFFSAESILLVVAFLLSMGLFLLRFIRLNFEQKEELQLKPNTNKIYDKANSPWRLVYENKHLKLLGLIIFLSVLSAKFIDYEYGYFASLHFTTEESLTSFFAFWFATINFGALIIQVFITNRIIGKLGIARSIFILPGSLLLALIALLLFPILSIVIIAKVLDGSLKQTIQKASVELVLLPIPQQLKLRTKTFLDVTVDNIATGISGVFLIFILDALALSNTWVLIILVLTIFAWFVVALFIKKEYLRSFRLSLHFNEGDEMGVTILDSIKRVLESGDDFQQLKIVSKLTQPQVTILSDSLLPLLKSKNESIIEMVISKLNESSKDYSSEIMSFTSHPEVKVRLMAYRYLLVHNQSIEPNFFLKLINDPDLLIRSMALLAIAMEYKFQKKVLNMFQLERRVGDLIKMAEKISDKPFQVNVNAVLFKIIGHLKLKSKYPWVMSLINDEDHRPEVLIGLGIIGQQKSIEQIFSVMDVNPDLVPSGIKGLSQFDFQMIHSLTENLIINNDVKRLQVISKVLAHYPNINSIQLLIKLSRSKNKSLTRSAVAAINTIVSNYPLLPINVDAVNTILLNEIEYYNSLFRNFVRVEKLVEKNQEENTFFLNIQKVYGKIIDDQLSTIFQLLNIKYPPENLTELVSIFKGDNIETRNNAIDYLNNLLSSGIRDQLVPILENEVISNQESLNNIRIEEDEFKSSLVNFEDENLKSDLLQFFNNEIKNKFDS